MISRLITLYNNNKFQLYNFGAYKPVLIMSTLRAAFGLYCQKNGKNETRMPFIDALLLISPIP